MTTRPPALPSVRDPCLAVLPFVPFLPVSDTALEYDGNSRSTAPGWWRKIPWEDVQTGALLKGKVELYSHEGFLAAFEPCEDGDFVVSVGCRMAFQERG